jgi:hypothetical protein
MDEKQLKEMGELASRLYEADPEVKAVLDKAAETVYPGVHARVAAKKTVDAGVAEITKAREEFKQDIAKERAARSRDASIERIQNDPALRIKPEEVAEVEKIMGERYIGTYEDAALVYRTRNQVAAPRATSYSMEVPGLGGAGGDETGWLKPAFGDLGNRSVLDRVTKRRVDEIRADFAAGRGDKWA